MPRSLDRARTPLRLNLRSHPLDARRVCRWLERHTTAAWQATHTIPKGITNVEFSSPDDIRRFRAAWLPA